MVVIRDGRAQAPDREGSLEAGDELLFVTDPEHEQALADVLTPGTDRGQVVENVTLPSAFG